MQKDLLQPLSGFRDYDKPTKNRVIGVVSKILKQFGYLPLETPALERQEILLNKLGDDSQRLLYLFEDNGKRKVGLRYDLTVSLARYVAANLNTLVFPFKRFEVGLVWRAVRAQRGRLRQFTQIDADIFGVDSDKAEEELLEIIAAVDQELKLDLTYQFNDRRAVQILLDDIKIPKETQAKVLKVLDKRDKMSPDNINDDLLALGLSDNQLKDIRVIFLSDKDSLSILEKRVDKKISQPLKDLLKKARKLGIKAQVNLGMVRGLDYYTSTIIEGVTDDYPSSLLGGGRYDSLVEKFIGKKVPAVGISFGVDRIVDLLENRETEIEEVLFLACLPETEIELRHWASDLRKAGKNVDVYLDSSVELAKQLKYAARKGYKNIYLPFENDWKIGTVIKRNLDSGEQSLIERKDV